MKVSKYKIPTILGVLFLVAGVVAGVVLVQQEQVFRLGASPDSTPQDVRITNVTDTSFTVNWITSKDTIGYINWGDSNSVSMQARQESNIPKRAHSVTVRGLTANTTLFFTINSGGEDYQNSGIPWSLQTGPTLQTSTKTLLVSGTVVKPDTQPAEGVIVYVSAGGAQTLSAITSQNGSFVIPLSAVRSATGTSYAQIDPQTTLLDIFVQAGSLGVASAQTFQAQANPLPSMTLGQVYDFRGENAVEEQNLVTEAVVELPESTSEATPLPDRFGTGGEEETGDEDVVITLESIEESGEIVSTSNPEFFGEGTPGTEIAITVESDPVSDTVTVPSSGTWRWSPPEGLEEGEHTVTLSWRDAQGFLRTLTRTFVVQAAEGDPSFESTPSGSTPSPTATPTTKPTATAAPTATPTTKPTANPTPTASPTPSGSPTPTPTPTSRVSVPSTESGIPVAGSLTPTLLLGTMGISFLIGGIYLSLKASK